MFFQVWSVEYNENIYTDDNLPVALEAYENYRLTFPDEVIILRKVEIMKDSRHEG